ncbi:MAG: hypothetical protein MUF22_02300 [Chitinispirillaceae bacterium]|jgi:ABC-type nickel/cobalt efflux system permease component RcnA|nr:hypothetical protein [Chitinispirillaceae bacterium]
MTFLNRYKKLASAAIIAAGLLAQSGVLAADSASFDNPFAAPGTGADSAITDTVTRSANTVAEHNPPFWYPLVTWQRDMNEQLSSTMKSLKQDFSLWKVLIVFFISLVYAVGHTGGPGHGKVILSTYFLTSDVKSRSSDALIAGLIVSLTHIGTAFLLSLVLYLIIHSLSMGSQRDMAEVSRRIGGAFVVLTGLALMLITLFRNKIPLFSREKNRDRFNKYSMYSVAVLAGIVPCPLAWFVLVFSISFGIYIYGIISVAGMAVGAAITVTVASYLSIIGRDTAMGLFSAERIATAGLWLRFAGGVVLVCVGILMVMPAR